MYIRIWYICTTGATLIDTGNVSRRAEDALKWFSTRLRWQYRIASRSNLSSHPWVWDLISTIRKMGVLLIISDVLLRKNWKSKRYLTFIVFKNHRSQKCGHELHLSMMKWLRLKVKVWNLTPAWDKYQDWIDCLTREIIIDYSKQFNLRKTVIYCLLMAHISLILRLYQDKLKINFSREEI